MLKPAVFCCSAALLAILAAGAQAGELSPGLTALDGISLRGALAYHDVAELAPAGMQALAETPVLAEPVGAPAAPRPMLAGGVIVPILAAAFGLMGLVQLRRARTGAIA